MPNNRQTRSSRSNRSVYASKSKPNTRSRRVKPTRSGVFKKIATLPSLIVEALAVAIICFLIFGMRADLHRSAQLKLLSETTNASIMPLVSPEQSAKESIQFLLFEKTAEHWDSCWN